METFEQFMRLASLTATLERVGWDSDRAERIALETIESLDRGHWADEDEVEL